MTNIRLLDPSEYDEEAAQHLFEESRYWLEIAIIAAHYASGGTEPANGQTTVKQELEALQRHPKPWTPKIVGEVFAQIRGRQP